jgi:hypothetical protein
MAKYSIKLVSHISAGDLGDTPNLLQLIAKHLQDMFNKVFEGTSDSAIVTWGTGEAADNIVLHFVPDRAGSYLTQKWPDALDHSRQHAGGHTEPRGRQTAGSEFYLWVREKPGAERHRYRALGYAKVAFHECLHNQFPFRGGDIHGDFGGGGLAALVPQGELPNQANIELMRRGLASFKVQQLL